MKYIFNNYLGICFVFIIINVTTVSAQYKLHSSAITNGSVNATGDYISNTSAGQTIIGESDNSTFKHFTGITYPMYSHITSVDLIGGLTPSIYKLEQNYPNPFNPLTTIKYQLPKKSFINLSVYDVLGRKVAELVNKQQNAGFYELKFDASALASGIYIYSIRSEKFNAVKKLMLIK